MFRYVEFYEKNVRRVRQVQILRTRACPTEICRVSKILSGSSKIRHKQQPTLLCSSHPSTMLKRRAGRKHLPTRRKEGKRIKSFSVSAHSPSLSKHSGQTSATESTGSGNEHESSAVAGIPKVVQTLPRWFDGQTNEKQVTILLNVFVTQKVFPRLKFYFDDLDKFTPNKKKSLCYEVSEQQWQ